MDNVTHSLFALTLARTRLGRRPGATVALLLSSNAPDIDIVSTAGGVLKYLQWHRGPTHGLLGVVGLGMATAGLVRWGLSLRAKGDRDSLPSFRELAVLSMLGVFLHVMMDLPTSYGTRLLSPFDWHWFAADWMPIVDIYLLVALMAGLYFGRGSEVARRRNVAIALTLMATNYVVRGVAHEEAIRLAPRLMGPTLPARCPGSVPTGAIVDSWPREPASLPAPGRVRCLVEIAAIPSFTSPFEWRVIARTSSSYELHDVNVLDARFWRAASEPEALWRLSTRYPDIWTPETLTAAGTVTGRIFLGFSRFPAARSFQDRQGGTTAQFRDMRFAIGGPGNPGRAGGGGRGGRGINPNSRSLFATTVRVDASGRVVEERLGE